MLAVVTALGAAHSQTPADVVADAGSHQFEVAAIKPAKPEDQGRSSYGSVDRISMKNYTLRRLIRVALGLKSDSQVIGGPKWIERQAFDIVAKINESDVAQMRKMDSRTRNAERDQMLQSLLMERFGLKVSHGERKLPVFALVVAKSGVKITRSKDQNSQSSRMSDQNGLVTAMNISMEGFARELEYLPEVGYRTVVDRTGLDGDYDFKMSYTPDRGDGIPPDGKYPGLFTALKEQLGLELKPEKAPVRVIAVESASEPTID